MSGSLTPPASPTERSAMSGMLKVDVPAPELIAETSQFETVETPVPRVIPFSTAQIFHSASPSAFPVAPFGPVRGTVNAVALPVVWPARWLRIPFWWWQTIWVPLQGTAQSCAGADEESARTATVGARRSTAFFIGTPVRR